MIGSAIFQIEEAKKELQFFASFNSPGFTQIVQE